jgi:hypothetical protein
MGGHMIGISKNIKSILPYVLLGISVGAVTGNHQTQWLTSFAISFSVCVIYAIGRALINKGII